jgi:hypothetical protein
MGGCDMNRMEKCAEAVVSVRSLSRPTIQVSNFSLERRILCSLFFLFLSLVYGGLIVWIFSPGGFHFQPVWAGILVGSCVLAVQQVLGGAIVWFLIKGTKYEISPGSWRRW